MNVIPQDPRLKFSTGSEYSIKYQQEMTQFEVFALASAVSHTVIFIDRNANDSTFPITRTPIFRF